MKNPSKPAPVLPRAVAALALALVPALPILAQQAAAPSPAPKPASAPAAAPETKPAPTPAEVTKAGSDEDIVVLTPFEVTSSRDTGYQATDTLAGTRIRTDLKDVGGGLSVYTKEFLKDVGATDGSTLLQYTTNTEVAGTRGTYAGLGNGTGVDEMGSLRAPSGAQRVRGLAAADNTRNFFVTDIPWDSYNVERIDIQRGPNSILFGLGSPAGIVNATTRMAEFRDRGSVEARVDSWGTVRTVLGVNHVLVPKVLAVRLDAALSDEKYQQDPAFQDSRRFYGALRFDPQLFGRSDFVTSLRANFEYGDIKANRPRIVPPNDSITPWFRSADTTSMWGGMGKYSVNNGYEIGANPASISGWLGGVGDQQQPVWLMDGVTGQLQRVYAGYINTGARNTDGSVRTSGQSLLGQRFSGTFFGVGSLPSYAANARLPFYQYGQYRTASLLDPTIFDFNNLLLDGPTKSEFEHWNAFNVSFAQTGWDQRVGLELNYDRQRYKRGGEAFITNPTLNIDILRNLQDLTANANYGRPFVTGGPGGGNSYVSDREYVRASLFGELRAQDLLRNNFLVKLLGRHRFNGVYSSEKYSTENLGWNLYANSQAWAGFWNRTDGSTSSLTDRPPFAMVYLGGSLATASGASGAGIPNVATGLTLNDSKVYLFDSTWTATGVAYNAPWTVPANLAAIFDANATTQASNPANYVGWNSNTTLNLMRYAGGQDKRLLTRAQKSLRETKSYAGSWQGYFWRDAFVATMGWRFDEVRSKGATALPVSTNRSILNIAETVYRLPDVFPANQTFKDHSVSGGGVLHLNKLFARDPLPLNVSVSYSKSDNFQVTDTRRDIYGTPIGNPSGSTEDVGILLSTKDGKYSFRAVKYETSVLNANTALNSSGLGNVVQQGLRFRNVFLYKLSNYPWTSREQNQDRNTWGLAYVNNATGRPVAAGNAATPPANSTLQTQAQADAMRDASIRAWNEIQKTLEAKGYFAAWGYTPTTSTALTDRATYEAAKTSPTALDPAPQFLPDPATVFAYTYTTPQGFAVTADTKSKGYEFELTANPLPNWRVSFNAAETTAVRTNVGGALLDEFVDYMDKQMDGPAGDMRQFSGGYSGSNEVRQNWAGWRGQYTLMKLQEGASAPELRKWRYNVVTNYSFRKGLLKGTGLGGSYRWQDKVVIGYPVVALTANLGSFDLTQPYYGPAEDAVDLWASYERKLTKKINWKVQLNVRNAFAKEGLIPISVQPDGKTWASVRTKPVRDWFVTNTLSF